MMKTKATLLLLNQMLERKSNQWVVPSLPLLVDQTMTMTMRRMGRETMLYLLLFLLPGVVEDCVDNEDDGYDDGDA